MPTAAAQLPEDPQALRELVLSLQVKVRLQEELIRLLRIDKYGTKSERLNDRQLELLEGEPGVQAGEIDTESAHAGDEQSIAPRPRKKKPRNPAPGRHPLPAHLPRVEQVIACAPEQCRCGQCGQATRVIGHEVSEQLDVEPARYFVRVTKREKRACGRCPDHGVRSAPMPARILPRSKLADGLLIDLLIGKYRGHLPLYRQSAMLWADARIELSRATLSHNIVAVGELCGAITRAMRQELLAGGYIQADETPVGVQTPEPTGKNHQAYLFEYSRPHGPVIFDFQMSRGRDGPKNFLRGFTGRLQCDGYAGYNDLDDGPIRRIACMAHIRRKFCDAQKVAPEDPRPLGILRLIKDLYRIEKQARDQGLDASARRQLRQEQSAPIMARLKERILQERQAVLPASAMGKACDYALGQWERMERYLEHGEVELDNNHCENGIRPVALGRKNWLHIGSEQAGAKIAPIMSLLETCRRLGINARDYLLDVLPGLSERDQSEVAALTPTQWQKHRQPVRENPVA